VWAWADVEIQKLQPYIDLIHGDAPAEKSLLLDYSRSSKFLVCMTAFNNKHYIVSVVTLISILTLVFQPLCASMFIVMDTLWGPPAFNVTNFAAISLNQGPEFQDLTVFLSAAGFASSSALYNFGDPSFIHDGYTVGPFQIPIAEGFNGSVSATTTAVKTNTNCFPMVTQSTELAGGGWTNAATFQGCTFNYPVGATVRHQFGTDVLPDCNNTGTPAYFRPIVLWFFTYDTTPPQGSATICSPTISLLDVVVTVDISTGNLTSVQEIGPFTSASPFSSLSQNVTGAPMNGRAFNGIVFNLTAADEFVLARSNATDLQLPASIFQAATTGPSGLIGAFQNNTFVGMATKVYGTYLHLVAKTLYFLPNEEPILVEVQSFQRRLWLSDVVVHMQAFVLLLIACLGTLVQVFHSYSRQKLRLQHIPGTIASSISISAETSVARLLDGKQEEDFEETLHNRTFSMDAGTMKIEMQSGVYQGPISTRRSAFALEQP